MSAGSSSGSSSGGSSSSSHCIKSNIRNPEPYLKTEDIQDTDEHGVVLSGTDVLIDHRHNPVEHLRVHGLDDTIASV